MSPFSITFKALRVKKNLSQKEAANMLGVEQSFVSAIERGHKPAPKKGFVDLVTLKYQLSNDDESSLAKALSISKHIYVLSAKAPTEVFEIFIALEKQANLLNKNQIYLMKLALGLEQIGLVSDLQNLEAPKM